MSRLDEARGWKDQLIPDKPIPYYILQSTLARYAWAGQLESRGNSVLEVGCGSGFGTSYLLDRGAGAAVGGDSSARAVAYAVQHYRKGRLHFLRMDGLRLPFRTGAFDLVLSLEVLEHVSDAGAMVVECRRVLKDDGVFICSTPNKSASSPDRPTPRARHHIKEFHPDELRALLESYFGEVSLFGMDPVGPFDRGLYRMATWLEPIIFSIPRVDLLINLVTRFVFRRYHLVKLANTEECDLLDAVDRRFWPFPLNAGAPLSGDIIAVARIHPRMADHGT